MLNSFAAVVLGAASLIIVNLAQAQQPEKPATIGWLATRSAGSGTGLNRLRRELAALGYIEGRSISFEFRSAEDNIDHLPTLANDLLQLKVNILVTPSTAEALAARKVTGTTPIVCLNVGDAVALGLIESLARPGGNITGVSNIAAVTASKRLELFKETSPKVSRVAVLWYPDDPGSAPQWRESQRIARELGLSLHSMEVKSADTYERAFNQAIKASSAALAVTQGPLTISNQKRIAALAIKYRLPTMMPRADLVESGGLMSYGPDRDEPYRRVASMIDKILKGAKPADLPVEQPTKFELVINLKTAKQIGLTIPPGVLARADRVIR